MTGHNALDPCKSLPALDIFSGRDDGHVQQLEMVGHNALDPGQTLLALDMFSGRIEVMSRR